MMESPESTDCSGKKNCQSAGSFVVAVFILLLMLIIHPLGNGPDVWAADSAEQGGAADGGTAGDENSGASEDESGDTSGTGEEEASDEEAEEEDPAGEEAEDEDPDEGEDEAEREDNGEDADDDADSLDDSEIISENGLYLSGTRRFALDGLEALSIPRKNTRLPDSLSRTALRSVGVMAEMADVQQWEETLLGRWRLMAARPDLPQLSYQPEGSPNIVLPSESLPTYRAGDTYVYSNGTWERVVATDGRSVQWVNYRGNKSTGSVDFTYKRSHWQTSARKGTRTFKHTEYLFGKSSSSLWPLAVGNKTQFDEFGTWYGKEGIANTYDSFWRCEVEDKERVLAPVGEFDSWVIICARYSDSISYPKSPAREHKTYYYAPAISHWVVENRNSRSGQSETRKELVAVMPDLLLFTGSDEDVVQLQQQFQDALENQVSGQSDIWITRSGGSSSTLTPLATFMREDGVYCRQYLHYVENREFSNTYAGMACRGTDGLWKVFRR